MTAFVYQYRLAGEPKVWLVRSTYGKDELRAKLEAKVGPLDLLLLVRSASSAIGKDAYLPEVNGIRNHIPAVPIGSKAVADSWNTVLEKLRAKGRVPGTPANSESVSDSWSRVIEKVTSKQRKDTA